ncbi:hypothetical protein [Cronobacter phage EspYZU13]|uniref:Uncharacterized protein n=1 Tax=Cronobacter phage EspYZU13 TaxID=3003790 RepID=A0AAE9W1Y1_9CAUD|nr:hypothetical protein [Cronobacter phage EspYZU13]
MGVQNTKGHVAGNGGLRGHSVGGVFPCVIYQKGLPDALTHWVLQPNGVHAGPHATFEEAWATAESYNNGQDDCPICEIRIAKVQLNEDKDTGETNAVAYNIHDEVTFDVYGVYGADKDGLEWHLCDYATYPEARDAMAQCIARINDAGGVGYTVEYRELLRMLS